VIEHDVTHRFLPAQKPAAMKSILQAALSPAGSKNLWLLHLIPCSSRKTHRIILPDAAAIPAISQCSPPQHLLLSSPTPLPTAAYPAALPTVQRDREFPFSSVWEVIKHDAARRLGDFPALPPRPRSQLPYQSLPPAAVNCVVNNDVSSPTLNLMGVKKKTPSFHYPVRGGHHRPSPPFPAAGAHRLNS
jgi:hypothetical protein